MTTSGVPGGPVDRNALLASTTEAAIAIARQSGAIATAAYIAHCSIRQPDGDHDYGFRDAAISDVVGVWAWDDRLDPNDLARLMSCTRDLTGYANTYADIGKHLGQDDKLRERGQKVLNFVSRVFEASFQEANDPDSEAQVEKPDIFDYIRIADLQDEAGDPEGATETARNIAPHLLAIVTDPAKLAKHDRRTIDQNIHKVLIHIGSLETPEAKQLFASIEKEGWKRQTVGYFVGKLARQFMIVGRVEDAIAVADSTFAGDPHFQLWDSALRLWEQGDEDAVQHYIGLVEQNAPNHFNVTDDFLTGWTSMVEVLEAAGRDDLIVKVFKSALDHGSGLIPLTQLAYRFGANGSSERFAELVFDLKLDQYWDDSGSHVKDARYLDKVVAAYQAGLKAKTEPAGEPK